jgi:hypothetical protein
MSLDDEIKSRFLTDTETILEGHLDELEGRFQFHEDGTIELLGEHRELSPVDRILLYLIARRYQFEADLAESDSVPYDEIYGVFPDKDKSTVRGYFMDLRESGFARKDDDGHELVVQSLPDAIDRIESKTTGT